MDHFKAAFEEELKACRSDMKETNGFTKFKEDRFHLEFDFVYDENEQDNSLKDIRVKTHAKIWIRNKYKRNLAITESYYVLVRNLDNYVEKIEEYLLLEKGLTLHKQKFINDVQYYVCIPVDV